MQCSPATGENQQSGAAVCGSFRSRNLCDLSVIMLVTPALPRLILAQQNQGRAQPRYVHHSGRGPTQVWVGPVKAMTVGFWVSVLFCLTFSIIYRAFMRILASAVIFRGDVGLNPTDKQEFQHINPLHFLGCFVLL